MKMNALWWWIDRWRSSTAYTDLTLEQQAAYRNLLDEATLRGGLLPNDERILAKASGDATAWRRVREAVLARFITREDGQLENATLTEVLDESRRRATNQRNWRERKKAKRDNGPDNADGLPRALDVNNRPGLKADYPDPGLSIRHPLTPSVEGERAATRSERARAEERLAAWRSEHPPIVSYLRELLEARGEAVPPEPPPCMHEPPCAEHERCIALLVVEERIDRKAALVMAARRVS